MVFDEPKRIRSRLSRQWWIQRVKITVWLYTLTPPPTKKLTWETLNWITLA